ncbi:MAG: hypothetical protein NTX46_01025, partial [Chloroflexi bacterium]|nr:hypothetical protein [Chloroflexota bacterium]
MSLKKVEPQKTVIENNGKNNTAQKVLPAGDATIEARLEELESRPRRNPVLHWIGFALSLAAFILLAVWVFSSRGSVPTTWVLFDIGLGVITAVEFFTRSGFRWNRIAYLRTRFFDFIAIIPALALVNHGFALEGVWVWLILIARFARVVDRLLGDGFIRR